MKWFKRIVFGILIAIPALILVVYLLLWIPPVQQKIKDMALKEVIKMTGSRIEIGELSFRPFNRLTLHEVYAADQHGDTLLYVATLSAGFDLKELLNNRLLIRSVHLDRVTANIRRDHPDAPFNYQFLIDAFSSKDTISNKEPSSLVFEIDDLHIRDANLRYDVLSEDSLKQGVFDSNHIGVSDLELEMRLRFKSVEDLDLKLKKLAFREQSGFYLKDLSANLHCENNKIGLDGWKMQLPASGIELRSLQVDYTGMPLDRLLEGALYDLQIDHSVISPRDLACFSPSLSSISDSLVVEGTLKGKFPAINLTTFNALLGDKITLNLSAGIADFNRWKTSPLHVGIDKLYITEAGLKILNLDKQSAAFPPPGYTWGGIFLSGGVSGSLSDLKFDLNAASDPVKLVLSGSGSYSFETQKANGDVELDVERFRYNGYTYRDIHLRAAYHNDSIGLGLVSRDPNASLKIRATGNLHPAKESVTLEADIDHWRLDTTHWLPMYPGAELSTRLSAGLRGFNPEKMTTDLVFDSLVFKTDKNTFRDPRLQLKYQAGKENSKMLRLNSSVLDASADGNFRLNLIAGSLFGTLSNYLPAIFKPAKNRPYSDDQLAFRLDLKDSEMLARAFGLPFSTDSASLKGNYYAGNSLVSLQVHIPQAIFNGIQLINTEIDIQTDTILKKMELAASSLNVKNGTDSLRLGANLQTIENGVSLAIDCSSRTSRMNGSGNLLSDIHFITDEKTGFSGLEVDIKPSKFQVNDQSFDLSASRIEWLQKQQQYTVSHFRLSHSESESLKIDGTVSGNPDDTLEIHLDHFRLETLVDAFMMNVPLSGEANGEISVNRLLTTPLIFTKDFSIRDIRMANKEIGSLNLVSSWSEEVKGLLFKADLVREGFSGSSVSGRVFPQADSLSVAVDIREIPLDWLSPFTGNTLFGLKGELGASLKAEGRLKAPDLNGIIYTKEANVGITMLNVQYGLSDTIRVVPGQITMDRFRIVDENNRSAVLSGKIDYGNFSTFSPRLQLKIDNFLVLNNEYQTDSLFYGMLRINGEVGITGSGKDILVDARLNNSDNSRVMINIPESAEEAQRYSSITFINVDSSAIPEATASSLSPALALPIKLKLSLLVDPGLKLGAVINPKTKDAVTVTGSGNLDFTYDLSNSGMSLLGNYIVKNGQCALSFRNIAKRVFSVREGGTLTFKGDPMATAFDITAVYSTRADLASLDKNFEDVMITTKIPVNATLTVTGNLNKMNLGYDFEFPSEKDEVKRKVDGLMYTDDIKIKEIAYLLAFNSFYPINSTQSRNTGTDLWTSLASSTLTSQLNNLLAGVLNENWSIGTELHANDNSLSDMEMDVNVSTRLFDDRVTLNSNIGYRNTPTTGSNNNFTGDFDMQLKLTRTGDFVLKVYNVTNNQYYERARTTQGAGVVYKKESRTFRDLFRRNKSKQKR